ncbi:hypothetical protein [Streptomyces adelaidensis]|jgi:hypothetical protein|uniref:hypothetical protein n=1 Tax=Streptomyces adelaidensis TaxID=2796465 RepID=UPI001906ADBF|nr:hypothetical protein [Streptomyces adelaidensis]
MTQRYPEPPVELPLDDWLYAAQAVEGCGTCAGAATRLAQAKKAGNSTARFEAARTIRLHPHEAAK